MTKYAHTDFIHLDFFNENESIIAFVVSYSFFFSFFFFKTNAVYKEE